MSLRNYLFGLKDKDEEEKMLMQKDLQKFVRKKDKEEKLKRDDEEKMKEEKLKKEIELQQQIQEETEKYFIEHQLKYPKSLAYELYKLYPTEKSGEKLIDLFDSYMSIYQDIENKFPDIDIDFFIEYLNSYDIDETGKKIYHINYGIIQSLYKIDLKTINYNKYIAYKFLKIIQSCQINIPRIGNNIIINEYFLFFNTGKEDASIKKIKDFINKLDAKIFMDNVNIKWNMLQHSIKNNLKSNYNSTSKPVPKPVPKPIPKPVPKPIPKQVPKPIPKQVPKPIPKPFPKMSSKSPKMSPQSPKMSSKSPKMSSKSPKMSPQSHKMSSKSPKMSSKSPKMSSKSPKMSSKSPKMSSKSPKMSPQSPINHKEMQDLSMEELFAKLAKK